MGVLLCGGHRVGGFCGFGFDVGLVVVQEVRIVIALATRTARV